MSETVLVTGGAGYIGSHAVLALLEAGFPPVVLDDLSTAQRRLVRRVSDIGPRRCVFRPSQALKFRYSGTKMVSQPIRLVATMKPSVLRGDHFSQPGEDVHWASIASVITASIQNDQ